VEVATTPTPEVVARQTRRRLTVAYKLKVLDAVESLRSQGQGAIGAYLRAEGLYYSNVRTWEQQRSKGLLASKLRGPKERSRDAILSENKQLRRKLDQVQKRLAKTEMIVELQKKLSAFMEMETPNLSEKNAA
jgi:hypothetical protein